MSLNESSSIKQRAFDLGLAFGSRLLELGLRVTIRKSDRKSKTVATTFPQSEPPKIASKGGEVNGLSRDKKALPRKARTAIEDKPVSGKKVLNRKAEANTKNKALPKSADRK